MKHRLVPRPLGMHEDRPVIPEWRCLDCGIIRQMDGSEIPGITVTVEHPCGRVGPQNVNGGRTAQTVDPPATAARRR
jgi:hypothetical protein